MKEHHRKGNPVSSQMGSKMPSAVQGTSLAGHPIHTHVDLGVKKTPTPTQTAGENYRTPRSGTKQFAYGKNST